MCEVGDPDFINKASIKQHTMGISMYLNNLRGLENF